MQRVPSDSITQAFLNDLGRYPLLTPEQEVLLGRKVQKMLPLRERHEAGEELTSQELRDLRNGKKAAERLICCNLRLVVMLAKKYTNRITHLTLLDLVQEGVIGLNRGVEKFDPSRGYKFSTYAYWWIRQGITRCLVKQESLITPPHTVGEKMAKVRQTINRLAHRNKEMPTVRQIAEELDMDREELEVMLHRSQRMASLDAPVSTNENCSEMGELVPDPRSLEPEEVAIDDLLRMEAALLNLDEREADVIKMRHGMDDYAPMTYTQIGRALDISRERVRQVEVRAMRKMRMYMAQINPLSQPKVGRHLARHRHENVNLVWGGSRA